MSSRAVCDSSLGGVVGRVWGKVGEPRASENLRDSSSATEMERRALGAVWRDTGGAANIPGLISEVERECTVSPLASGLSHNLVPSSSSGTSSRL